DFATPKRSGRWLRRHVSTLPLEGLPCRGFTLVREREHDLHERQRALELARTRVLEFIGAPDAQMQLAARLWGHCCVCGKTLTDPLSLERGIGPDCHKSYVDNIRSVARKLTQGGESVSAERVARITHLPAEFVAEILSEAPVAAQ